MPVIKYRHVEDMETPRVDSSAAPEEIFRRFVALRRRSLLLAPRRYPRGVFKFRSLEEAQAHREQVTVENIARLERERGGKARGS